MVAKSSVFPFLLYKITICAPRVCIMLRDIARKNKMEQCVKKRVRTLKKCTPVSIYNRGVINILASS